MGSSFFFLFVRFFFFLFSFASVERRPINLLSMPPIHPPPSAVVTATRSVDGLADSLACLSLSPDLSHIYGLGTHESFLLYFARRTNDRWAMPIAAEVVDVPMLNSIAESFAFTLIFHLTDKMAIELRSFFLKQSGIGFGFHEIKIMRV